MKKSLKQKGTEKKRNLKWKIKKNQCKRERIKEKTFNIS
jgi:hypothetical protein